MLPRYRKMFLMFAVAALLPSLLLSCAELTPRDKEADAQYENAKRLLDNSGGNGASLDEPRLILETLVAQHPNYARAYIELARHAVKQGYRFSTPMGAVYQDGALDASEKFIKQALAIDANLADAYVFYGHLALEQGNPKKSRVLLQRAETLGTTNPWLEMNWAALLEKEGAKDEATTRLERVATRKDVEPRIVANAIALLIEYKGTENKVDDTQNLYIKLLAMSPNDAWSRGNYAEFLLHKKNDYDGAIKYAQEALAIMRYGIGERIYATALCAKGAHFLFERGQRNEAFSLFDEAKKTYPDLEELYYRAALRDATFEAALGLVEYGVDINVADPDGTSAVAWWALRNDEAKVKKLIDRHANLNQVSAFGGTPLHFAIRNNSMPMFNLLLANGADPSILNKDGVSPLQSARQLGRVEFAQALEAMGQKH